MAPIGIIFTTLTKFKFCIKFNRLFSIPLVTLSDARHIQFPTRKWAHYALTAEAYIQDLMLVNASRSRLTLIFGY